MANSEKGEVSFEALGITWTLHFSTNALCELEDASGKSAVELANSLADESKAKISTLRLMVWAGLKSCHSDITTEKTGDVIDAAGFDLIASKIAKAFELAFPTTASIYFDYQRT